mmetsp:Transcript_19108/g.62294  ORF Transcript_19108/g.62294 Transcript_19108/m.62294 type:complete len:125 (+) Transcript_19108:296-670(+)
MPTQMAMANLVSTGSLAVIGTTLLGETLFPMLNVPIPPQLNTLFENKMSTCGISWFLGNTIYGNMMSTGAFEVYFDGKTVFSKLESKQLPNIGNILSGVEEAMKQRKPIANEEPASNASETDIF